MDFNTKQLFAWETDNSNKSAFDTFEESPITQSCDNEYDSSDDKENINPFANSRVATQVDLTDRAANRRPLGDITHLFRKPQDESDRCDELKLQFKVKQMTKAMR